MAPAHHVLSGTTAKVVDLQSKPHLNGCAAVVGSFNAEKGRHNVKVICPELNDFVVIALKPDNLEQGAAARLPDAKCIEADDYLLDDVLHVMEAVDSMEEYSAPVAVACLTKTVTSLMDGDTSLPSSRVILSALNAMRTNARNGGAAPQLFSVAVLNLPFLLTGPESAPLVDAAEVKLHTSLLDLLAEGLTLYLSTPEILSSAMIALRQLLACWVQNDDTIEFVGVGEARLPGVLRSGVLGTLVAMLNKNPPSSATDEGSLELHEHAIAAFSAISGLMPSDIRAAALVDAGVVPPLLRAVGTIWSTAAGQQAKVVVGSGRNRKEKAQKPKEPEPDLSPEAIEAACELVRAALALLKALGQATSGRAGLKAAGAIEALDTLIAASPVPGATEEMVALKARLESPDGEDVAAKLSGTERHDGSEPREDAPTFLKARQANSVRDSSPKGPTAEDKATKSSGASLTPRGGSGVGEIEATYWY